MKTEILTDFQICISVTLVGTQPKMNGNETMAVEKRKGNNSEKLPTLLSTRGS